MDRLTGDALARLVKAHVRKAGLAREVRPHALRHEAITRALDLCAGDDLVLKAEQFKPLRDKLLRGAADFYGKLEGLLKGQPDRASRGAMGNAYFELGELTAKIGDKPAALVAHRNGLAVRRELASDPANDAKAREDVAKSLTAAAELLSETGESAEALARFEEARELLEGLPLSGPGSDGRRALLGRLERSMGIVLKSTGKSAAALSAYQRSVETLTRLADDNPAVTEFRSRLADSHNTLGVLQKETGKPNEALESHLRARAIRQKLADDNPTVSEFRSRLANSHVSIGILQKETGKPGEALDSYRRARAIYQKLVDDNPALTEFRKGLAISHSDVGLLLGQLGKPAEALDSFRRALAIVSPHSAGPARMGQVAVGRSASNPRFPGFRNENCKFSWTEG